MTATLNTSQTGRATIAAPAAKDAKQTTTFASLRAVEAEGPDALTAFIRRDMKERDDRAAQEWRDYALFCPADRENPSRSYTHVVNPEGQMYEIRDTAEGWKEFAGCPVQKLVTAINDAARRMGLTIRTESKHREIAHRIERAVWRGERRWEWFPETDDSPAGWYAVPIGGR